MAFIIIQPLSHVLAQGTAFSYQGRLNDAGIPATGIYDLQFAIYDSAANGNRIGNPVTNYTVGVSNGLFTTIIDFGPDIFTGSNYWLQIAVRTNGGTVFSGLAPRQPVLPVPYAIMANNASNLLGTLPAAQLTGALPVSQLSGTLSLAQLPPGILTNAAAFDAAGTALSATNGLTNVILRAGWMAGQQDGPSRLPILAVAGFYGAFADTIWTNYNGVTGISNAEYALDKYLAPFGYKYIVLDDGWGRTNLDSNGLEQLSYGIAPYFSGVADFIHHFHTNHNKIGLYFDSPGSGVGLSTAGLQHGIGPPLLAPNINAVSSYGVDYVKFDTPEINAEMTAYVLATNGSAVFLSGAVDAAFDDNGNGPLPAVYPAMFNSFRVVSGGDITSYSQVIRWTDVLMTNNWWRYVGPGHFIDMDYIGGAQGNGWEALKTHLIICALFSSPIYDDCGFTGGPQSWFTNVDLLSIDQDPAVICAQRCLQTNNCDIYLKPLGSPNGPQYALGVVNRGFVTANVTLAFTSIASLSEMANWSAYDCVSNAGWVFQNTNAFSVTLGACDSVLWKLLPGAAVTTNLLQPSSYGFSIQAQVISNGVLSLVNIPWDPDATNFIARGQLTNDVTQCFAVEYLFTALKAANLWGRMDCLYPMVPGSPYLNAVSASFALTPVGSVVTNASGIAGDGSSSYFTNGYHFINSATHYSLNSGSIGVYNETVSPVGVVWMGGYDGVSDTMLENYVDGVWGSLNDTPATGVTYNSNASGLLAVSRTSSVSGSVYAAGQIVSRTTSSVSVPNSYVILGADMHNGSPSYYCNGQVAGAWIGGGMTPGELLAIKNIWDQYEAILGRRANQ